MAVIQFTPADALQTTIVEAGNYPCVITSITTKPSSSQKSVHHIAEFQITDGKYKGKERTVFFNSEANDLFAPGGMLMLPQASLLDVDAAIRNIKKEPSFVNLDTDDLIGKPFECQWTVATFEGRLYNHIVNFFPSGYSKNNPTASW